MPNLIEIVKEMRDEIEDEIKDANKLKRTTNRLAIATFKRGGSSNSQRSSNSNKKARQRKRKSSKRQPTIKDKLSVARKESQLSVMFGRPL